ncbi:RHS repeat-associated core domain-containing protein [Pseudomonas soli]|uniref:RHS repeat-associated core domain-containing protein n=1 Tax=Pseudomonas soli TaxID=1306993 RepID=UPI0028AFCACB|nr:RHS repeat-associated core domain-containing protein [Pseudomonas soli]
MTMRLLAVDPLSSPIAAVTRIEHMITAYMPYGRGSCREMAALGFTGQLRERGLEIYLLGNGHRGYNPILMRFNSADQLSPMGKGGLNSYAYCQGNPINFIDPSGRIMGIPGWTASGVAALAGTYTTYKDVGAFRANPTFSGGKLTQSIIGGVVAAYTLTGAVLQYNNSPLGDSMINDATVGAALLTLREPAANIVMSAVKGVQSAYVSASNRYHAWGQRGREVSMGMDNFGSREPSGSLQKVVVQGGNSGYQSSVRLRHGSSATSNNSSQDNSLNPSRRSSVNDDAFDLESMVENMRT